MLYRTQNLILQIVLLVCVGIILGMIYYTYSTVTEGDITIQAKVKEVRDAMPHSDKIASKDDVHKGVLEIKEYIPLSNTCPSTKCPSVEDIVSGIFPGRNTGITQAGRYFDIKSDGSYELLPDYSFFDPEDPFPDMSILDAPLRDGNVHIDQDKIDNTIDGSYADTQRSASMKGSQSRMDDRTRDQKNYYNTISARMSTGLHDADQHHKDFMRATRSKAPDTHERDMRKDLNKKGLYK
jgi:hypothetical protein